MVRGRRSRRSHPCGSPRRGRQHTAGASCDHAAMEGPRERSKTAVTTQEAFEAVAQFEGAVGFGPYSTAIEQEFNVLKVDGKHATNIDYPSFTSIRLIFKRGHLTEEAEGFVRFSRSPEAVQIFSRYGGVAERSP